MNSKEFEQRKKLLREYREKFGNDKFATDFSTELSCISMINSILAYGGFGFTAEEVLKNEEESYHNYLAGYVEKLGREKVIALIDRQIESIDHINSCVYTDSEGCTYNSIVWKE